jgi:fructose-bisphosphate aldolase class II
MDVVAAIHRRCPDTHLVMHGSSSVPAELQEVFREHGGQMPETYGVPIDQLQRSIGHGVRKINIDTDCRLAMAAQIRRIAEQHPGELDPRKYLAPSMAAMSELCAARYEQFGAAGQASRIGRLVPLDEMAARYRSGDIRAAA